MKSPAQLKYWDKAAETACFTHPISFDALSKYIDLQSIILDYGCGYGRLMYDIHLAGYENIAGVETSNELVRRATQENSEYDIRHIAHCATGLSSDTIDCVLLFAVLTCIPNTQHQTQVIDEVYRILKPGGTLYISDYLLQPHNIETGRYGAEGVFTTSDGAIFRHHTIEHISQLLSSFEQMSQFDVRVKTLRGNSAVATQWIYRKSPLK